MHVMICVSGYTCVKGGEVGWVAGVGGGCSVADLRYCASFRSHVLLPQTGVVTDGDGQQAERHGAAKSAQWFFEERKTSVTAAPHIHFCSPLLSLADGEQEPPHSLARLTTTCVAWRGSELGVINLSTSLTAH